ncbi:hypothetical protein QWZ06_02280 [Chryseobacterium tructae]|uniref:hypothetical protein n=1 Tax=Chryseobacterium tructae TaxID=1037380 RepID=UPI0025B46BB8|nr:hypothetical protein [Chryseobacterium tructae]MDN3691172.1 hypothetical protein [Chryseobacterium tructae]
MKKTVVKLGALFFLLTVGNIDAQTSTLTNNIVDFSSIKESEGTANVDIPLHQMSIKGYTLPVSIYYNGGGVKVDNESSNIGQNWELSSQGVISRSAHSNFDESTERVVASGKIKWYPVGDNPYGGNYVECIGIDVIPSKGYLNNLNLAKQIYNAFKNYVPPIGIQPNTNNMHRIDDRPTRSDWQSYSLSQDVHPDVFTVVIPNKSSFKFLFDPDGNIATDTPENYKITYDKKGTDLIQEFTLIDEDGITYTFSNIEIFNSEIYDNQISLTTSGETRKTPYTSVNTLPGLDQNSINSTTPFCQNDSNYPSSPDLIAKYRAPKPISWYLSKISNIYGEAISFGYERVRTVSVPRASYKNLIQLNNNYPYPSYPAWPKGGTNVLLSEVPVIKAITSNYESLEFDYRKYRQDLISSGDKNLLKELNTISLYQKFIFFKKPTAPVKTIRFNHQYVVSQDTYLESVSDVGAYTRLFLEGVDILGKGNEMISYYKFKYKTPEKLPHKQSFNIDFWGYFKNGDAKGVFPELYRYNNNSVNNFERNIFSIYPRAASGDVGVKLSDNTYLEKKYFRDSTPSFEDASNGILSEIESFGGKTTYEYEPNYFDYYGVKREGPGIRVKKIIKNDNINTYTKEFIYGKNSDGKGYISKPARYAYRRSPGSTGGNWWPLLDHYITSVNSSNEKVNYDEIKIQDVYNQENKGYVINRYSFFNAYYTPNLSIGNFQYVSPTLNSSYLIRSQTFNGGYYFDTEEYYSDYEENLGKLNGHLVNQRIFDKGNNLLKETKNEYSIKFNSIPDFETSITGGYYFNNYLFRYLLTKQTVEEKFGNKMISNQTVYSRNDKDKVTEITRSGPSTTNKTVIKYLYENSDNIGSSIRFGNRLNEPSLIKKYVDNKLVETTNRKFKEFVIPFITRPILSGPGSPISYYVITDLQYEEKSIDGTTFLHDSENLKYDLYGNIVSRKIKDVYESTVYGYQNTLPIAVVAGTANYSQVEGLLGDIVGASNDGVTSYNESDLQVNWMISEKIQLSHKA